MNPSTKKSSMIDTPKLSSMPMTSMNRIANFTRQISKDFLMFIQLIQFSTIYDYKELS